MDLARALILVVATGCYSFTTLGRARTVDRGHLELLAAPGATGTLGTAGDANLRPAIEIGGRYGIAEGADLGLRVSSAGATASARFQLVRAARVEVLAAPGIAYTPADKLALEIPLVLGIDLGADQIVIAPSVVYQLRTGLPRALQFVFVGASLGYVWQIARRIALMPELAVLANAYVERGYGTFASAGPAMQAAVAILWD